MVKSRYIGDKLIPPLIGNPYNMYINPYGLGLMTIPYYMEIMGVDRPDRTYDFNVCLMAFRLDVNYTPLFRTLRERVLISHQNGKNAGKASTQKCQTDMRGYVIVPRRV